MPLTEIAIVLTVVALAGPVGLWVARRERRRRRQAQAELAAQRQRIYAALEQGATAVLAIDSAGTVIWFAGRLADLSAERCLGAPEREVLAPCPEALDVVAQARRGTTLARRLPWEGVTVDVRARPIFDPAGRVEEVVLTLVDVSTEERERDRAERLARIRAALLAAVNHQLRTPLHGISAMTELLHGSALDERQRDWVALLAESSDELAHVVDDLIDYAELDAGRVRLEAEPFNLRTLIEAVLSSHRQPAERRGLSLISRYPHDCSEEVAGDRRRVRTVVDTLVALAVENTAEGHVIVNVEESDRHLDETSIRIQVEGSGAGLAQDAAPPIGRGFFNAPIAPSPGGRLTGLASAVMEGLVELMGGRVGFSSVPERGFALTLDVAFPRAIANDRATAPLPQDQPSPAPSSADRAHGRILLVAADALQQQALEHLLHALEHEVDAVGTAADALALLDQRGYDAILLDGIAADDERRNPTAAIRARDDAQRDIPIIAVTADAMRGSKQRYLAAGINDYLSKPTKLEALCQMLAHWSQRAAGDSAAPAQERAGIDFAVLERLHAAAGREESDVGGQLIDAFLDTAPAQLLRIHDATTEQDAAALAEALAPFSTSCRLLGAQRLEELCAALRGAVADADQFGGHRALAAVKGEFALVERELAQYRAAQAHHERLADTG